jgi:hypothetical protein
MPGPSSPLRPKRDGGCVRVVAHLLSAFFFFCCCHVLSEAGQGYGFGIIDVYYWCVLVKYGNILFMHVYVCYAYSSLKWPGWPSWPDLDQGRSNTREETPWDEMTSLSSARYADPLFIVTYRHLSSLFLFTSCSSWSCSYSCCKASSTLFRTRSMDSKDEREIEVHASSTRQTACVTSACIHIPRVSWWRATAGSHLCIHSSCSLCEATWNCFLPRYSPCGL